MVKRKSREVRGVYVRDRYWVGGFAFAGMIDSKGTKAMFRLGVMELVVMALGTGEIAVSCPCPCPPGFLSL